MELNELLDLTAKVKKEYENGFFTEEETNKLLQLNQLLPIKSKNVNEENKEKEMETFKLDAKINPIAYISRNSVLIPVYDDASIPRKNISEKQPISNTIKTHVPAPIVSKQYVEEMSQKVDSLSKGGDSLFLTEVDIFNVVKQTIGLSPINNYLSEDVSLFLSTKIHTRIGEEGTVISTVVGKFYDSENEHTDTINFNFVFTFKQGEEQVNLSAVEIILPNIDKDENGEYIDKSDNFSFNKPLTKDNQGFVSKLIARTLTDLSVKYLI